ncbi:RNA polymerase sigma factor [Planctomycetota bacterium]
MPGPVIEALMLEDKMLIWKFNHGDREAFCRIYQKYLDDLLTLAVSLLGDAHAAQDVVQDVFIRFGESNGGFQLRGSLKSYLAVCVANQARDIYRSAKRHQTVGLNEAQHIASAAADPVGWAISNEQQQRISRALAEIPYDQREVIILHLHGDMKFREIARTQQTSIKTVQSRYRYGLDKLRSLLNSEVCNATIG